MLVVISILSVIFLAYSNGANDNFKGVATLYGSGTTTFFGALSWATIATGLGSIAALYFASGLVAAFSGKGLVPDAVAATQNYALAVILGSAATVMLATRAGFPISTTHALAGGLVGAGLLASPIGVDWSRLGTTFFLPLLLSPIVAVMLAGCLHSLLRLARTQFGINRRTCICVGTKEIGLAPVEVGAALASQAFATQIQLSTANGGKAVCFDRYEGNVVGVEAGTVLDRAHFLSAGVVCFARALNDTPKIAAIMLVAGPRISECRFRQRM